MGSLFVFALLRSHVEKGSFERISPAKTIVTQVVIPTFQESNTRPPTARCFNGIGCYRCIFREDLVLEVLCRSRDKDTLVSIHRKVHEGDQIPQGFTRSGPRLNKQVLWRSKCITNCTHHGFLPRPRGTTNIAESSIECFERRLATHDSSFSAPLVSSPAKPSK